ncbi:MAG TPA: hypothetical protein VN228_00525 [Pyrinomonadaceae bacterium]|nr:hypothetical protein [Pyrinomonadaceae bacterium]
MEEQIMEVRPGTTLRSFILAVFLGVCPATIHVAGQEQAAAPSAGGAPAASQPEAKPAAEAAPIPRICVPPPLLKVIETSQSSNTSEAVRNALVSFMNGPSVEVIPLESRIMVHIEAEAKSKSCNLVLYSTLTMQKSGGTTRIGSTLKKAAPAAGLIALSTNPMANTVATVARVAAEVLGEITVDRKKKDKVVYEYKLVPVGGDLPVIADTQRYRSEEDSEDLISPMLAKNAELVVIAAMRHFNLELARKKQNAQPATPGPDVQTAQAQPQAADQDVGDK